jgi:hypothetical protein
MCAALFQEKNTSGELIWLSRVHHLNQELSLFKIAVKKVEENFKEEAVF